MLRLCGLALALSLVGCGTYDSSLAIGDVTKEQLVVLTKALPGNTHSLSIRGTGNIKGKATIALILNGKPYKTEEIEGNVKFSWGGDWYADSAEILYRPSNVREGAIKIEYSFSTI